MTLAEHLFWKHPRWKYPLESYIEFQLCIHFGNIPKMTRQNYTYEGA